MIYAYCYKYAKNQRIDHGFVCRLTNLYSEATLIIIGKLLNVVGAHIHQYHDNASVVSVVSVTIEACARTVLAAAVINGLFEKLFHIVSRKISLVNRSHPQFP